jgi:hypothetical protein
VSNLLLNTVRRVSATTATATATGVAETTPEAPPGFQCLLAPNPHSCCNTHHKEGGVLEHEDYEGWFKTLTSETAQFVAAQRKFPNFPIVGFVEVAGDDDRGRDGVEDRKHSDSHHETFQFFAITPQSTTTLVQPGVSTWSTFGYGSPYEDLVLLLLLLLDDNVTSNAKQGHKSGDQEQRAHQKTGEKGCNNKALKIVDARVPHKADPGNWIPIHSAHGNDCDSFDRRQGPGDDVEQVGVFGNRFSAPLKSSSQKPGETQNDPPNGTGHGEDVDEKENSCAECGVGATATNCSKFRVTSDLFVTRYPTNYVTKRDKKITKGKENYGSFRIAKSVHIDEKSA